MKLTEYQLEINNDADFQAWKSTWNGHSEIPETVSKYVRREILPRILEDMKKLLRLPNNDDENF